MKRNIVETVLGAIVLLVAGIFLAFSMRAGDVGASSGGYEITADFSGIGGLSVGDDVQISGVKVGAVGGVTLDEDTYLARVSIMVDGDIKLPTDTAALISSESLLGMIPPGGRIQYTQAPQNLEQLLGQFIISMQNDDKDGTN